MGVLYGTWPLTTDITQSLIQATGGIVAWERLDVDLNVWILGWGAHALATDPWSYFDANIFHPSPSTLATGEHFLGLQPIAGPVFWLTGNAVLAYNVTILMVAWLTAVATFVAVGRWTASAPAAFFAGAVFAFSPVVARDFGRMNESPVVLFPIVLLLAWRAAETPRARVLVSLALVTAWQAFAGMYIAYELALTLLAFSPAILWHARTQGRLGLAPLVAMGIGLALLVPVAVPYLSMKAGGGISSGGSTIALDLLSTSVWANFLKLGREVTWPVAALAALGLAVGSKETRPLRFGLGCILVLGVLVAAGSKSPGVFQFFRAVVPGFENIRLPVRLLVISFLATAIASGLGVAVVLGRLGAWKPRAATAASAVVLLAAVALFLRVPVSPIQVRAMPRKPVDWQVYDFLAQQEGTGAVLELPIYGSPHDAGVAVANGQYMIGSTRHWRPLINGYSGYFPSSHVLASVLGQRLPAPRAFDDLCTFIDFEWLVVHGKLMSGRGKLFGNTELPIEPVARFGRDAVYRVTRECGALQDRTLAEVKGERRDRTLRDLPTEELPVEARRGVVRPTIPRKFITGVHQYVPTIVTNTSDVVWPGLTTHAENRVAVESRWVPSDGRPPIRAAGATPLMADLAPGESIEVWVPVYPPRVGTYTLEIGLLQTGPGWFADSGGEGIHSEQAVSSPWTLG